MLLVGGNGGGSSSPSAEKSSALRASAARVRAPAAFRGERGHQRVGLTQETQQNPIVSNKDIPVLTLTDPFLKLLNKLQSLLWFVSCVRVPLHLQTVSHISRYFCRICLPLGSELSISSQVGYIFQSFHDARIYPVIQIFPVI